MRKVLSITLFLLGSINHLFSRPVEQSLALRVANNFAFQFSELRSTSELTLVYTAPADFSLRSEVNALYYIYTVPNDGGFVIVSGDDNTMPILAYSDQGTFPVSEIPDNIKNWLEFYSREINWVIESGYNAGPDIQKAWNKLLNNERSYLNEGIILKTANWDQQEPFNDKCPVIRNKRTATGCVATAMGIIMNYHQWPKQGNGEVSYSLSIQNESSHKEMDIYANFDVAYDWNNMPHSLTNGISWTQTQRDAVSTLLFHCGASVRMSYGVEESGAYTHYVLNALVNYFGYDHGMIYTMRDYYTFDDWHNMLRNEIEEGRPILYGGRTLRNDGHRFVVDGYNSNNYYHINWGWGGKSNGYYLLSSLEPSTQGTGGSTDGRGFAYDQDMIIGIQKTIEGSQPTHELYYDIRGGGGYEKPGLSIRSDVIRKGVPFRVYSSYIADACQRDFDGHIGLFRVNQEGEIKESLSIFNAKIAGATFEDLPTEDFELIIRGDVEEGDRVQMLYSSDNKVTWKPFRGVQKVVQLSLPIEASTVGNISPDIRDGIHVYPVIAESVIYIYMDHPEEVNKITIYNISGEIVKEKAVNVNDYEKSISIGDLNSGIYLLTIHSYKNTQTYKFLKK